MTCPLCEALMINGVFCHERGCPNTHAEYEDGEWVHYYRCWNCGDTLPLDVACTCESEANKEEESNAVLH